MNVRFRPDSSCAANIEAGPLRATTRHSIHYFPVASAFATLAGAFDEELRTNHFSEMCTDYPPFTPLGAKIRLANHRTSARMKKRKQPVEEFRWRITQIKGTPAGFLGYVYASTESEAPKKALEKFRVHTTMIIIAQRDE